MGGMCACVSDNQKSQSYGGEQYSNIQPKRQSAGGDHDQDNDYYTNGGGDYQPVKRMNSPVQLKNKTLDLPPPEILFELPVMTVEDQILENYVNELKMIGKDKAMQFKELITILYGAYLTLIKEIVFQKSYIQRQGIITKIDQQTWKYQRLQYKNLIYSMFDEEAYKVDQLVEVSCQTLNLTTDQFVNMMSQVYADQDSKSQQLQNSQTSSNSTEINQSELINNASPNKQNQGAYSNYGAKRTSNIKTIQQRIEDKIQQIRFKYALNFSSNMGPNGPANGSSKVEMSVQKYEEIQGFIDDIKREQIYFDSQQEFKKNANINGDRQSQEFHLDSVDGRKTRDSSDNDDTDDSSDHSQIQDIVIQGFEIEDRLQMKYGITLDEYYDLQTRHLNSLQLRSDGQNPLSTQLSKQFSQYQQDVDQDLVAQNNVKV
ncbi:UNKNOWN [Stylonychia lemnae]|uniref:Uncharacterized protein n=1 Tax=Stylonychia lemnae TaxID=5949 RepID=A0A078ACI0_STYLE|nr:UNKNOWN [Stylonychia lemnae]|eukprot:CDW79884.1 UNKNOWN [Stylonychia lemnae]